MTWFNIPSTFTKTKNHLNCFLEYICVFEYIGTLHLFPQIYSNMPLYKMKWNSFFYNLLLMLYSKIIRKNIVKIFQNFVVGYTQTCTSLENNTINVTPKGVTVMCFHLIFKLYPRFIIPIEIIIIVSLLLLLNVDYY